jgi:hypothetical protein
MVRAGAGAKAGIFYKLEPEPHKNDSAALFMILQARTATGTTNKTEKENQVPITMTYRVLIYR